MILLLLFRAFKYWCFELTVLFLKREIWLVEFRTAFSIDQSASLADSGGKSWSSLWLCAAQSLSSVVNFAVRLRLFPSVPPLKAFCLVFFSPSFTPRKGLKWFKALDIIAVGGDWEGGSFFRVDSRHPKRSKYAASSVQEEEVGGNRVRTGGSSSCWWPRRGDGAV